jgi:DNA-binding CsgD family transcriptional regulator
MPWLDDIDLRDVRRWSRSLRLSQSVTDVRRAALERLAQLVPADLTSWDRIETSLAGSVEHEALPEDAQGPAPYATAITLRPEPSEVVVVGLRRVERTFSERDRDVLALVGPAIEHALGVAEARERLIRALASDPPPGTAVVLLNSYGEIEQSSLDAERWLAEHFGPAQHPGWLPTPVAEWLALPPRPPLLSVREGRRLRVQLLPGDPHALLLEEQVTWFSADDLTRLGLTPREREVLEAAHAIGDESSIADELFLSAHAVSERLDRVEAKLGADSGAEAVARALLASI